MKYKIRISLGITAIAVVFALGFIVSNQQTFGANLCGSGLGCGGASEYGCDGCGGINYPSPLSNFVGDEAFGHGFHHFHGDFGFHHFGGFHHFR
jgi:hypothetical protein